jgi:hypothetical protein
VKGGLRDLVLKNAKGMVGKPAIEQFIATSRNALIDAKADARNEFIARKGSFRTDPNGLIHANALFDSIQETKSQATTQQYIYSLSSWVRVRASGSTGLSELLGGERPGNLVIKLDIPRPTAPVRVESAAWPGLNDRTRKTLKDNFGDMTLWDIKPPYLVMQVTTRQWHIFSGSESIRLEKSADRDNVSFANSGMPLYWLAARGRSSDDALGGEQPTFPQALAAAHVLWGDVMKHKVRDLGALGD